MFSFERRDPGNLKLALNSLERNGGCLGKFWAAPELWNMSRMLDVSGTPKVIPYSLILGACVLYVVSFFLSPNLGCVSNSRKLVCMGIVGEVRLWRVAFYDGLRKGQKATRKGKISWNAFNRFFHWEKKSKKNPPGKRQESDCLRFRFPTLRNFLFSELVLVDSWFCGTENNLIQTYVKHV